MKKIVIFCLLIVASFAAGAMITSGTGPVKTPQKVTGGLPAYSHIAPQLFNSALASGEYTLLDIRTAEEHQAGHLKNAKQIDYYQTQQFSDYLDTLDKNGKYLIYCRTGHRSGLALTIMQNKGFKNVSDMDGGYNAWLAENLAIEK